MVEEEELVLEKVAEKIAEEISHLVFLGKVHLKQKYLAKEKGGQNKCQWNLEWTEAGHYGGHSAGSFFRLKTDKDTDRVRFMWQRNRR